MSNVRDRFNQITAKAKTSGDVEDAIRKVEAEREALIRQSTEKLAAVKLEPDPDLRRALKTDGVRIGERISDASSLLVSLRARLTEIREDESLIRRGGRPYWRSWREAMRTGGTQG